MMPASILEAIWRVSDDDPMNGYAWGNIASGKDVDIS
jgi:hypothetical protein